MAGQNVYLMFHDPDQEKKMRNVIHITQSTSCCPSHLHIIPVFDQPVRTKLIFDIWYIPVSRGWRLTPLYLERNQLYCIPLPTARTPTSQERSNHCIKISTAVNSYKVIQNIDNSSKIIFISWPHPTLWWTECSETPLINYEGRPCRHGASERNEELGRSGERGRRDVIIIIMSLILTLLTPVKHTPTLQTYKLGNKSPSIMNSFCQFWELS